MKSVRRLSRAIMTAGRHKNVANHTVYSRSHGILIELMAIVALVLILFAGPAGADVLLSAAFDSDSQGFVYADDAFRGTNQPGYAFGAFNSTVGYAGGGLYVNLGGIDNTTVADGMSGGLSHDFDVATAGQVTINLRYRLVHAGTFEPDECGQALVAVDGVLLSLSANDYLEQYCGLSGGDPDQDTGWRQVALNVVLSAGSHTVTLGGYLNKKTWGNETTWIYFDDIVIDENGSGGTETSCSDGIDNDGDQLIDCSDPDCNADASCSGLTALMSATFDTDSQGFVYSDDTFRGTGQPNYAAGAFDPAAGYAAGGLSVTLGGIDNTTIANGMSGGWSRDFDTTAAGQATITLRYRLVHTGTFESDECGQALVAVDGALLGLNANDYLEQYCGLTGGDPDQDTGWQQVTLNVVLSSGSHTLTVGGYLNKKTWGNEATHIYLDDIVIMIEAPSQPQASNAVLSGGGGTASDANYQLRATLGQPLSSGALLVPNTGAGFWFTTAAYLNAPATPFDQIDPFNIDSDGDGFPDWWEFHYFGYDLSQRPYDDYDGDGIFNWFEYILGRDPSQPDPDGVLDKTDTDGDGMPDGWELQHGLDPLVPDAQGDLDGDGVSNQTEYIGGTDPNDAADKPPLYNYEYDDNGNLKSMQRP